MVLAVTSLCQRHAGRMRLSSLHTDQGVDPDGEIIEKRGIGHPRMASLAPARLEPSNREYSNRPRVVSLLQMVNGLDHGPSMPQRVSWFVIKRRSPDVPTRLCEDHAWNANPDWRIRGDEQFRPDGARTGRAPGSYRRPEPMANRHLRFHNADCRGFWVQQPARHR